MKYEVTIHTQHTRGVTHVEPTPIQTLTCDIMMLEQTVAHANQIALDYIMDTTNEPRPGRVVNNGYLIRWKAMG